MSSKISIIYMGTPPFACPSLELLHKHVEVKAVVTAVDKPSGRGQKLQASAVKQKAIELGIPVLQPEKLRNPDFLLELSSYQADLFVVLAFRMLPKLVWDMPPLGTINLHASLLPQYRGAAPINWVIMNGETETGLSTFFIQEEIDTGAILLQDKLSIGPNEDMGSLHDRMMDTGADLLLATVNGIASNTLVAKEQDLSKVKELKAAPKLFKEQCKINLKRKAQEVHNQIRGLSPYPAAFVFMKDSNQNEIQIKLLGSKLTGDKTTDNPGTCVYKEKKFLLACADEWLEITDLKAAGKRKMTVSDWLNGLGKTENIIFY